MTAAYLHIPFCEHICFYCDFNKVFLEGQPVDEYVDAVIREMELMHARFPDEKLDTFYIGGGTPTTLTAAQLDRLLAAVQETFRLPAGAEFTVEANPESASAEKFAVMRNYGVNRLSMGVQSFNNRILKKIGRIHTAEQVFQCVEDARDAGFENISIDLIFRLPTQTLADFQDSLRQALSLDLPHYSIYALILENKTIFYNLMRKGKLPLPSEDEEADMYALAMETMAQAGREQYEISNYAKPGFQSRHNLTYWQNGSYFGFGAGAHGYMAGSRYNNHGPIQHYLEPLRQGESPIFHQSELTQKEKVEEELMLGMRTMSGVDRQVFARKYGIALEELYGGVISSLQAEGLVSWKGERLTLTRKGTFLGNKVFRSFLMD